MVKRCIAKHTSTTIWVLSYLQKAAAPGTGKVVPAFKTALRLNNPKAFWGDETSAQPGNLQEMMLRETALAWIRHRPTISTPKEPAEETQCEYGI